MTRQNKRIKEIDILYSIGTILAVFGHSHSSNGAPYQGTLFHHCIIFIYLFHMALFFFIGIVYSGLYFVL